MFLVCLFNYSIIKNKNYLCHLHRFYFTLPAKPDVFQKGLTIKMLSYLFEGLQICISKTFEIDILFSIERLRTYIGVVYRCERQLSTLITGQL